MALHDVFLVCVSFFAEILGTISGFGSSTYFVPTALFFEEFTFVITITAFLHTVSNAFKIYSFKTGFNRRQFLKVAVPSIVACGLGALFVSSINQKVAELILGALLVVISALKLLSMFPKRPIHEGGLLVIGSLSGFLTGLVGSGGALRGLVLTSMGLTKESFVFLSSVIDIGGDGIRLGVYLSKGYMQWSQWYYVPLLFIAAACGTYIGKRILTRVSESWFERIVLVFTFIGGVILIWSSQIPKAD